MAIRDEVVRVLRSPEAASINFVINGRLINGGGLARVANALEGVITPAGRQYGLQIIVNPGVRTNSTIRTTLSGAVIAPGIDAEYCSDVNAFSFSDNRLNGVPLEALAVHEAVHAALDMDRVSMWAIDDEAAAYIAQCVYLGNKGITSSGAGASPTFVAAFAAAASIRGGGGLTPALLQQVRTALQTDPNYQSYAAPSSRYLRNG